VVEAAVGVDGDERVVAVAARRHVQAVGVQVGRLVDVVDQSHPQQVPRSYPHARVSRPARRTPGAAVSDTFRTPSRLASTGGWARSWPEVPLLGAPGP